MTTAIRMARREFYAAPTRWLPGDEARRMLAGYQRRQYAAVASDFKFKPGFLYTQVRAISSRINQNYDGWPSSELKKSYRTFIGKPVFVNHGNEDYHKARGKVVAARYIENGRDKYVEVVQEIDAARFPKLAHEIKSGGLDSVSMGVEAGFTICSYCGNKAVDVPDFCAHVKYHKGEVLPRINARTGAHEDVMVYEKCYKLGFFELSYVFDPADETAVVSRVLSAGHRRRGAEAEQQVPDEIQEGEMPTGSMPTARRRKRAYGEIEAPEDIDTLREDDDDDDNEFQHYIESPDELRGPDLDQTKRLDRAQEQEGLDTDRRVEDVEDIGGTPMPNRSARRRTKATRRTRQARRAQVLAPQVLMDPRTGRRYYAADEKPPPEDSAPPGPPAEESDDDLIEEAENDLEQAEDDEGDDEGGYADDDDSDDDEDSDEDDDSDDDGGEHIHVHHHFDDDDDGSDDDLDDLGAEGDLGEAEGLPLPPPPGAPPPGGGGGDDAPPWLRGSGLHDSPYPAYPGEVTGEWGMQDVRTNPKRRVGPPNQMRREVGAPVPEHGRHEGNYATSTQKKRRATKGRQPMSLAQRGKLVSASTRQHFGGDDGKVDGGPYHLDDNDEGVQEEVFISQVPGKESVAVPGPGDGTISNTENNLVARINRRSHELQRDIIAYEQITGRRVVQGEAVENPDQVNPTVPDPAGEELTGTDFTDVGLENVETQPKDASVRAFRAFDNWLVQTTGRTAHQHGNPNFIRRSAARFCQASGLRVEALFPALGIVLREARRNEGTTQGATMRKRADQKLEVAAPQDRIDVEAPVSDTTDAEAQASQFDLGDFGGNASDNLADPELSPDSQIWAPGEGGSTKSSVRKAEGITAVRYAEAFIEAGLAPNTSEEKWKIAGLAQTMRHGTIVDRTRLLDAINTTRRTAARRTAGARRQPSLPQGLGGRQMTAATSHEAAAYGDDSSIFFK